VLPVPCSRPLSQSILCLQWKPIQLSSLGKCEQDEDTVDRTLRQGRSTVKPISKTAQSNSVTVRTLKGVPPKSGGVSTSSVMHGKVSMNKSY
jgi:hypothetical protein